MKRELIVQLHTEFERLVHIDTETSIEFWLARDMQRVLGYKRWENFSKVIDKAVTACEVAGYERRDHILDVTKMVTLGSGAERKVDDCALTRYACYLVAQTYLAIQTRRQELIEKRLAEMERLSARKKLIGSEKTLSGLIYERVEDERSNSYKRRPGTVWRRYDAADRSRPSDSNLLREAMVPE
jgi:DNA-damage-inducible protein D